VEPFVILGVAAGLSAVVVWWATNQPGGRPRPKRPRTVSVRAPAPEPAAPPGEEPGFDRFVLLPTDSDEPPDERPSPAVSLVRLAVIITFFAALGVGVLAILGYLVKTQLDQYFTGL
jgi:hypothetical protein